MTTPRAPREHLIRCAPPRQLHLARADTPAKDDTPEPQTRSDRPVMFGHFARFNEWTEIDSWWEGRFREQLAPGAFTKTFREQAGAIQVLFNHGMDMLVGDKPLGRHTILREDDLGAYAEVPLSDTSYNADLEQLLRDQALRGQSFKFSVVKETWDKEDTDLPERTIQEVRLYEFGPVTFPAYQATSAGIRSRADFQVWQGLGDQARDEFARSLPHIPGTPGRPAAPAGTGPQGAARAGEPPTRGHSRRLVSRALMAARTRELREVTL